MHIIHLDENGDRVIRFYAEPQFLSDGTVDHFTPTFPLKIVMIGMCTYNMMLKKSMHLRMN